MTLLVKSTYLGLYGIINSPKMDKAVSCLIHSISNDCNEFVVVTSTPLSYELGYAELRIIPPLSMTPIKCEVKLSEEKALIEGVKGFQTRMFVTNSSRIDQRRLEILVDQKKIVMRAV